MTLPRRDEERVHVWFESSGTYDSTVAAIRAGLAERGVSVSGADGTRHVILAFSEVDNKLLQFIRDIRSRTRGHVLALAVSSSALNLSDPWRLLQAGAADTLIWENGGLAAAQIRAKLDRWQTIEGLLGDVITRGQLIGNSPVWVSLMRRIIEAAYFTSAPVLLIGESGTGKELVARFIHDLSRRSNEHRSQGDLVIFDCGTIIPELSGSELFGHERGAFTGAVSDRIGAFALAADGTLFLDEIGDLPLALQPQLLRAIQERTYKRLGSNLWQTIDFRLICATNRDLKELLERGQFRLDLYHRISGWIFNLPPLRNRREDILPLANQFVASACVGGHQIEFDQAVREYLLNHSYPGNVRELRQLIHRIAPRHVGPGPITVADIPEEDRPRDNNLQPAWPDEFLEKTIEDAIALGLGLKEIRQAATETAIRIALRSENGNLHRAACRLGVSDRALQMRRASGKIPRESSAA